MSRKVNRSANLHDPGDDSVAQLRELLPELRKGPKKLRLIAKWEKRFQKLNMEAKAAVRHTDVPEVRELETLQYRNMTRYYQRHQALVGSLQALLEEARLRVRILALKNEGVRELWKSCRIPSPNARDPHHVALYVALAEQALHLTDSGNPASATARARRQHNPSTARLRGQVNKLFREATAEGGTLNSKTLCDRLDANKVELPENVAWGRECKSWCEALKVHSGAVSTWISRSKSPK